MSPIDEPPPFAEGWEADVFATVLALIEAGGTSPAEWTAALATAVADAQAAGDPIDGTTAFEHWLTALEVLCASAGVADHSQVDERQAAWRDAYARTPHGQPVELGTVRYGGAAWRATH